MSGGRPEIILFFCVRKPSALVNGCFPARFGALEKYSLDCYAYTQTRLLNVNVPAKTGAPQKNLEVAPFNHLRILTGILFAKSRVPTNNLGMSGGRPEIILFFCFRQPSALVNGCLPARFGALEKYSLGC